MEPLLAKRRTGALDVVGIGEISLDHVGELERVPVGGEKLSLHSWRQLPGGQVATALLACARLGLRAAVIGAVGDDAAASQALEPLRSAGVDVAGVCVRVGTPTRFALILVDAEGERTVLWHRPAQLALSSDDVDPAAIERGRALHVDASDPDLALWAAEHARASGIPVFLDADHLAPGVEALLAAADFPVISQGLARELGGTGREEDGLRALAGLGARFPVVTLGERGALAGDAEAPLRMPAFAVDVRDTTGAGDVFHAGFLAAALAGAGGAEAVRFANAAAALNCSALGAQGGLPSRADVEALLEAGRGR